MESPLQERVWLARTFEHVLHFVRSVTVTVSPNQIITIISHSEGGYARACFFG